MMKFMVTYLIIVSSMAPMCPDGYQGCTDPHLRSITRQQQAFFETEDEALDFILDAPETYQRFQLIELGEDGNKLREVNK